jgi:hypothetical protein
MSAGRISIGVFFVACDLPTPHPVSKKVLQFSHDETEVIQAGWPFDFQA